MTEELARLGLEVDSDGFVKAKRRMDDFARSADKAERSTDRLAQAARRAGRVMGVGMRAAALAVAGVTANAVRMGVEFESELTKINTLVGVSRVQIDEYRKGILDLAPAVGRGPAELARAMFAITSAGTRGAAAMDLLEESAKAAAIGLGDTRDIALTAGAAVTAFGKENLSAADAVAIMVGTVEQGNLEASALAGSLGQVLSIAAAAGITFQDAGAFIASFTRQGVSATQAVTALRGTLATIVREPTKKTEEAFDKMSMSIEGFREQIREEGFINAFQQLIDRAQEYGVEIGSLIPEIEALSGAMAVFTSNGESAADILEKVEAAVGSVEERFREAVENDPALWFAQLRGEFSALSIELGSALLPAIGALLDQIKSTDEEAGALREGFMALSLGVANLAKGILLVAAGFNQLKIIAAGAIQPLASGIENLGERAQAFATRFALAFDDDVPERIKQMQLEVIDAAVAFDDTGAAIAEYRVEIAESNDTLFELMYGLDQFIETVKEQEKGIDGAGTAATGWSKSLLQMMEIIEEFSGVVDGSQEGVEEVIKTTEKWKEALADLEAEVAGPIAVALREYEKQVAKVTTAVRDESLAEEDAARFVELYRFQLEETIDTIETDFVRGMNAMIDRVVAASFAMTGMTRDARNLGDEARNAFDQIGSGFAQSIFQGQGPLSALQSAFTGFGGRGIASALNQNDMSKFFETAFKDGIGEAFKDSEFQKNSAAGYALALGQAMEGNYGQAALTAAGNAFGGELGAMIGSIVGDMLFGDSVPKFQARGTRATSGTDAGTDLTLDTAFGDFQLAFRDLSDSQKQAVEEGYRSFFNFIGDLTSGLSAEQQQRVADAVQEFGISSRSGPDSPEAQMKLLLSDIAATFPPFFGELIKAEATLDDQLERFADLLSLEGLIATGRGIPNLGFETTALLANELAMAGETLVETMKRIKSGFESLSTLSLLTGNALADTSEGLARLAAGVTRAFGGDADALSSRLDSIFEAFYSEEERFEAAVASAGDAGERLLMELLSGIDGVSFESDMLTRGGFRDLLELLTSGAFDLSDQQLALLTEAGATIAGLIDAEERLAEARQDAADGLADDWLRAIESIRGALDAQLLGVSNLRPEERLNEAERQLRQAVADAQGGDLDAARDIPGLFQQAIAEGARFFGTATAGFEAYQDDLRSLLQGLELGPNAVPVQEAQLNVLGEISEKASRQVAALEAMASGNAIQDFGSAEQASGFGGKSDQSVLSGSVNVSLDSIAARIESGNEDRRAIADEQIEQLSQLVEQLRQQTRRGMRSEIRRPESDAARPAVVRGRNT